MLETNLDFPEWMVASPVVLLLLARWAVTLGKTLKEKCQQLLSIFIESGWAHGAHHEWGLVGGADAAVGAPDDSLWPVQGDIKVVIDNFHVQIDAHPWIQQLVTGELRTVS